jgi:hypothetical protein
MRDDVGIEHDLHALPSANPAESRGRVLGALGHRPR